MSGIPVIKSLVKVVTLREYTYKDNNHEVEIKVPNINGLSNTELQDTLNSEYLDESTRLYKDFMTNMGVDKLDEAHLALFTNYSEKVNNDQLLVLENITTQIAGSGSESVQYNTIDKQKQLLITLPSLFKDDNYVDIISENIISQMKEKTNPSQGIMYFYDSGMPGDFAQIKPDQTFYINADSQLVIVFNEAEVAPAAMGIVEFVIPIDVIQKDLVSNTYIK